MKKQRFLILCLVVLSTVVYYSLKRTYKKAPTKENPEYLVKVSKKDGSVIEIELEEYVAGVLAGEMPVSFDKEALKAQAVAARTFVLSRNLKVDTTTASQVFLDVATLKKNWGNSFKSNYKKIKEAVKETEGLVLMYDGSYISALFFSTSNGKTENNEDYFSGAPMMYLRSVDSHWDLEVSTKVHNQKEFTAKELKKLFNVETLSFDIKSYKDSGRVDKVDVSGKQYTGRQIREILGLSSSDFEILNNGGSYSFSTVGFGHGVGMSQYGAQGMALEGYKYDAILLHYYTGVDIIELK